MTAYIFGATVEAGGDKFCLFVSPRPTFQGYDDVLANYSGIFDDAAYSFGHNIPFVEGDLFIL